MFSPTAILVLVFAGIGIVSLAEGIWQQFKPKPPPLPPKKWKIQFSAPDGYQLRAYMLTEQEVNRMMALIHHEQMPSDQWPCTGSAC